MFLDDWIDWIEFCQDMDDRECPRCYGLGYSRDYETGDLYECPWCDGDGCIF